MAFQRSGKVFWLEAITSTNLSAENFSMGIESIIKPIPSEDTLEDLAISKILHHKSAGHKPYNQENRDTCII